MSVGTARTLWCFTKKYAQVVRLTTITLTRPLKCHKMRIMLLCKIWRSSWKKFHQLSFHNKTLIPNLRSVSHWNPQGKAETNHLKKNQRRSQRHKLSFGSVNIVKGPTIFQKVRLVCITMGKSRAKATLKWWRTLKQKSCLLVNTKKSLKHGKSKLTKRKRRRKRKAR